MRAITEAQLRASLINATQSERKGLTLLHDISATPWDSIDFFAARDKKLAHAGYIAIELDGELTGVMLRQAEARPRSRAQCSWCADVQLPNDVVLFTAKRAGDAGRRGDTVGTLVCDEFQCSVNARKRPPMAYIGFDVDAARLARIDALREHVAGFVREVRGG